MNRLFFIRHGLAQFNVDNLFAGQVDTLLTDEGREQAKAAATKLKNDHISIDVILSSPLSRALETAQIIAKEINYPASKIVETDDLLERSFGELEGTFAPEFFNKHIYKDIDDIPGAETIIALQNRAKKFFNKLEAVEANNILVVGHGAFGRAFIRVSKDEPYLNEYTNPFTQLKNAEPIEIDIQKQ
jgi:broad specificity phosphatase PhoE